MFFDFTSMQDRSYLINSGESVRRGYQTGSLFQNQTAEKLSRAGAANALSLSRGALFAGAMRHGARLCAALATGIYCGDKHCAEYCEN
jgi:hypothetical protein